MISLWTEPLITLAQAARLRPPCRAGRPTHISTIYRWISRGVRGHKLEAIRLGGAWFTSVEAMARFAERLSSNQTASAQPEITKENPRVEEALDQAGF